MTLTLEVWSDIACPWCYIGKRRLESALRAFTEKTEEVVGLRWRSFQLDSNAPPAYPGLRYVEGLALKYGRSEAEAQEMVDMMSAAGKKEGILFDFDSIRPGNTFDAHRILHFAEKHGKQDALKERLFAAYFCEGVLMSDAEALVRCASEVGLNPLEVRGVLEGDLYAEDVRSDQARAAELGVRGVPFFLVGQRFGISGAQPAERILEVLLEASRGGELNEHAEGAVCSPDSPC